MCFTHLQYLFGLNYPGKYQRLYLWVKKINKNKEKDKSLYLAGGFLFCTFYVITNMRSMETEGVIFVLLC